ncbi:hypothetical protein [Aureispira anguillae]|uniref:Cytochrome c family protein n=1 Tax=Aureispira anguillae TaxID=2864201 RepID=A0A915YBB8_9BACT|nr:hypothetical protein [Aureispira anguillae]BDS09938.1 hypothetical protein AsAng_0006430 [Aureispira anguillae]
MKKSIIISVVLLIAIIALAYYFSSKPAPNPVVDPPKSTACTADPAWFVGAVPEPDYQNFPSDPNNCDFHQISWQYFLWLTETVDNGQLRFETLFNDQAINPNAENPTSHTLGGIVQAGGPAGILIDQNGRAVYTTMMINDIYRNFAIDSSLYTTNGLKNIAPNTNFPNGSFSLKAAWKIVEEGEDASDFYTTSADLYLLKKEGEKIALSDETVNQTVALVGFHIAVVVENHPEFIWATFEHINNSPTIDTNNNINAPVSDQNYTFYKAGTPAADCNQFNEAIVQLDEATQKLSPVSQIFRQYRNGAGDSTNNANIDSLNASVHRQLPNGSVWKNYREVGAIWFKVNNDLVPNWTPNNDPTPRITGSTRLSNTVIESFTQNIRSENECFSCHNSMAVTNTFNPSLTVAGKNVLTSHIILQNYLDSVATDKRIDRTK